MRVNLNKTSKKGGIGHNVYLIYMKILFFYMKDKIKTRVGHLILYHCPKLFAHSYIYNRTHKNKIDFKNPITYDEKIHWLMVFLYDKSYGKFADKIAVRDYVTKLGLKNLLIPLEGRGIYKTAEQINFSELPEKYILKTNHGSGEDFYFINDGEKKVNENQVRKKIKNALKKNFAYHNYQYHYSGIKPLIICEKYLQTSGQERLTDFKIVCSFGNPIAILVCNDRNNGRDYYSTDWNYLEYVKQEYRSGFLEEKPVVLDEMLKASSLLSKPFPLARIDFYIVNDKLYFGEITLTPSDGNHQYLTDFGQKELGKQIRLR